MRYPLNTTAQPSGLHGAHNIIVAPYRPPEVWMLGELDLSADIWSFGCLWYELIAVHAPLRWEDDKRWGMSTITHLLYQMACRTGDNYKAELCRKCPGAITHLRANSNAHLISKW